MSLIIERLLPAHALLFLAFFCLPLAAYSQTPSCTTATCTAATAGENDVINALPSSSNINATVTVTIPACALDSCVWLKPYNYTVPTGVTTLTIQGQTTCTGTGDPAFNNLACADSTYIVDGLTYTNADPGLLGLTIPSGKTLRLTGITLVGSKACRNSFSGSVCQTYNGAFHFGGGGQLRWDHSHAYGIDDGIFIVGGQVTGVIDHSVLIGQRGSMSRTSGEQYGDAAWNSDTGLGSSNSIFFEQDYLYDASNDCSTGGRWVMRFNTAVGHNGSEPFLNHPTGGNSRGRGCRSTELYKNTATHPAPQGTLCGDVVFFHSSGVSMIWGNNAPGSGSGGCSSASGFKHFMSLHSMRRNNNTYAQSGTPNGWGYCGTSFNGTGSNWDQNGNASTGSRCLDQPGLGKGDLLSGGFPSVTNSTTGCDSSSACAWPRQALEPTYVWQNTWFNPHFGGDGFWSNYEGEVEIANSDYYLDADETTGNTITFTGATGVGSGTLAARPSTCTTGVGYWATDQGNWNTSGNGAGQGVLYTCTATNTWNAYYTPYAYPHPLTQGVQAGSKDPSNLRAIIH